MARPLTVAQIIQRIRWRTGQDKSKFIADDEILTYVDSAACELHDILVSTFKDYSIDYADITIEADTNVYTLPANFLKLRGMDYVSTKTIKMDAFLFDERERFINNTATSSDSYTNVRYCILGNTIMFAPQPATGTLLRMWYVPTFPLITTTTQSLSCFSGWEELIIASVGARIAVKAEESPTAFINEKKEMMRRIEEAGQLRDVSGSGMVTDTTGVNDYDTFPFNRIGV